MIILMILVAGVVVVVVGTFVLAIIGSIVVGLRQGIKSR